MPFLQLWLLYVVTGSDTGNDTSRETCIEYNSRLECGNPESPVNLKIINGIKSKTDKWPWVAYMKVYKKGKIEQCGGSFISQQFVLTGLRSF